MTPRFAWPSYKDQWESRVSELLLDGQDASELIDNDYLRLRCADREWATAKVALSLSTDEAVPANCNRPSAHVVISCPATHLRRAYRIDPTSDGLGFEGKLTLTTST